MGFSFKKAEIPKAKALRFAVLHAGIGLAAILIGSQMNYNNELFKGVTFAISAGTFLFISLI
jgi:zinc transporter ZupT